MNSKIRNIILLTAVVVLSAAVFALNYYRQHTETMTVYYLDVGKADAILLMTKNGAVLIDTGTKGCEDQILNKLNAHGLTRIDCMILTHFDKDHVGGAAGLIKSAEVGRVIQSPLAGDSSEYSKYVKAADKRGIVPEIPDSEYSLSIGGIELTIYPPLKSEYGVSESNNSSLIVRAVYGHCSFLFMADAEEARLQEFINAGAAECGVLKMPHHGAWQGLLKPLVEMSGTKAVVITCSDGEPEDTRTMAMLKELSITPYVTRKGTVRAECDGEAIVIEYDT